MLDEKCKRCSYWAKKSRTTVHEVIIYGDCSNPEVRERGCSQCGMPKKEPLYIVTEPRTMDAYVEWMPHREFGCIKFTPDNNK